RVCAAYFFGKIGCNGRLFVFLDKNNYFFKKTLFYFFVGYFILWKSLTTGVAYQEFTNRGIFIALVVAILGGAAKLFGFFPQSLTAIAIV
ncbi:MAG: hypothetical protein O9295_27535, partial [Microcystis sp. LE18-22.4A]|uniref:hypothetical protein n=1 Tax=Microcystis sp. LE18-22.4A TaxID=3016432 RepID=UPI0022BE92E5